MNKTLINNLICPQCQKSSWSSQEFVGDANEIEEGVLTCQECAEWYRIEFGILDILPRSLANIQATQTFGEKHNLPSKEYTQTEDQSYKNSQISFFENTVDDYEKRVVNSSFYMALYEVTFVDWVKRTLKKDDCVLDVGCGTGKQSLLLAEHGIRSVGIDISEKMLRLARNKLKTEQKAHLVDLILADGENPPLKSKMFEAGVLGGFLHHVNNPDITVRNITNKIKDEGYLYSSDPHKSPVRFIFDFMMKVWKLYDEEASDDPLISKNRVQQWFSDAGLSCSTRISTYLPPHLLYLMSVKTNTKVLKVSDAIFNTIPFVKNLGGVIIAEGTKKAQKGDDDV